MHHRGGRVGHTTRFYSKNADVVSPNLFATVGYQPSLYANSGTDAKADSTDSEPEPDIRESLERRLQAAEVHLQDGNAGADDGEHGSDLSDGGDTGNTHSDSDLDDLLQDL